jgi:uncharacterized protein (DUF1330 family)
VHALGKAPVNLITEIDVTNPDAYGTEFASKAQATIKAAGGEFTVIGDRPVKLSRPARLEAFFEALAAMSDTAHLVQMVI